jgi:hypothetical protein
MEIKLYTQWVEPIFVTRVVRLYVGLEPRAMVFLVFMTVVKKTAVEIVGWKLTNL